MLKDPSYRAALRLSAYYLVFGLCWILFSDLALNALVTDHTLNTQLQTFKGWFYVGFTALLLLVWSHSAFIRIRRLTEHDPLTGLKNRSWGIQRGHQKVKEGLPFHLIIIDIDDFKLLNDTEGHHHGDSTLIHVANKLLAHLPSGGEVARIGGDEFALFDDASSQQEILAYLKALTQELTPKYRSDDLHQLSVSVGVAHFGGENDFKELLKQGELAVHHAKYVGKGQVVLYQDALQKQVQEVVALTKSLRGAIARKEFEVAYQPQFDLLSAEVVGVEALARWRLEGEVISPGMFIPLAEKAGLITELTQVVMEKAISELEEHQLLGCQLAKLSINLSPVQFNSPGGVQALLLSMEKHKQSLQHLTFEMTESAIMENLADAASVLEQLVEGGAKISIDDFGTGYSSFCLLKELPIHELKIDKGLIKDIAGDGNDEKIVKAVAAMAKALGLQLVAEGVEQKEQAEVLKVCGCPIVQGYLFAKPMGLTELIDFIQSPQPN